MANFEIANTFLDYAFSEANSSPDKDAFYPKSNLKLLQEPTKRWANQDLNDAIIAIDCGTVQTSLKWYMDHPNFTEYYILGDSNPADFAGTPDYTSPLQTAVFHKKLRRYVSFGTITSFGYRYVGIKIPAQTSTDGLSYFAIGSFAIATNLTQLVCNPKFDLIVSAKQPVERIEFEDGSAQKLKTSTIAKAWITLDFANNRTETENEEVWDWFIDCTKTILLHENLGNTTNAYLAVPQTEDAITEVQVSYNNFNFNPIILEVVSL